MSGASEQPGLFDVATPEPPPLREVLGPWARMRRLAVVSDDRQYRYHMARQWDDKLPPLGWVMLNPSTADHEKDDPTTVRVVNFSADWGYGSALVANLFALRSSSPKLLTTSGLDPIGPANAEAVRSLAGMDVVCAWGASIPDYYRHRGRAVRETLRCLGCTTYHLGMTAGGHPRHPLYLPSTTELVRW